MVKYVGGLDLETVCRRGYVVLGHLRPGFRRGSGGGVAGGGEGRRGTLISRTASVRTFSGAIAECRRRRNPTLA